MALSIIESCVNCLACEPLCPGNAIYEAQPHFPIEGAILDAFGEAVNKPGSLTGVPPQKVAAMMIEIQAR